MAQREETGCLVVGETMLPYTVIRSARRRRTISFTVQSEGRLRVMAPKGASSFRINGLIRQRAGWITRKIGLLRRHESQRPGPDFTGGSYVNYLGEKHRLCVTRDNSRKAGCRLGNGEIEINFCDEGLSPPALREETRLELLLWYKKQARREFQSRLPVWGSKLGVSCARLVVTGSARRWGSCSAKGVVRLNWRLIMTPPELIDYVVAHELCHIRHRNHARAFWDCLGGAMPDCKTRRKRLREWERALWTDGEEAI